MITKDKMISLSGEKDYAVDINDTELLEEANSKLYNIKKQYIDRVKTVVANTNQYKMYLIKNLEYIKSQLVLNINVKTTEEAVKVLKEKVDMRLLFGIDNQYTEVFESELFFKEAYYEGIEDTQEEAEISMSNIINKKDGFIKINYSIEENKGLGMWMYRLSIYSAKLLGYIAKDSDTGRQSYFLKSNSDLDDHSYDMYFDIIEIYEICNKCENQYSAIKQLCELLNIQIEYEIEQSHKYESNLKILQETCLLEQSYPVLHDCLKYHSELLEIVNIEGKKYINYSSNSYKGENIFTFSNEFIGNKAVSIGQKDNKIKYGKGTVNPKLTLFCLFGLLYKIPFQELPKNHRHKTFGYNRKENYYIVPQYTESVLLEAQNRVRKLKEAKVKPTKFTGEKCKVIFGEEIYKSVFGNYYKVEEIG
ncbi:hypothetical protein [Clostridium sp. C2-6-12]|uniref:hypothetical protein n=1 Tax=Clostridium sp. C2-6-12 TaxID=2698832 RepID=UPI00136BBE2D|nr:hypothetical protein [Clostridium sp. C2-6-12]